MALLLIFCFSKTSGILSAVMDIAQTIGAGQIKIAKHKSGLIVTVGLQVPAVKADNLIMDYNKMGAIIHMFMFANRAVT